MPGVELTLPAAWSTLDLTDAERLRRDVSALVRKRIGRADERAAHRARLRASLLEQAEAAALRGGWLQGYLTIDLGAAPLSAALTAYQLPAPTGGLDGLVERVAEARPGAQVDRGEGSFGPFVRAVRLLDEPVPAGLVDDLAGAVDDEPRVGAQAGPSGIGPVPVLAADYWCDPGHGVLVALSFSTPTTVLAGELLGLFDAVTSTLVVHRSAGQES